MQALNKVSLIAYESFSTQINHIISDVFTENNIKLQ